MMAAEHLMLLDPGDAQRIRIQCAGCGAAVSLALDGAADLVVPAACPGCGNAIGTSPVSQVANDLLRHLRQWRQASGNGAAFGLRFEFSPMRHAGPPPPAPGGGR